MATVLRVDCIEVANDEASELTIDIIEHDLNHLKYLESNFIFFLLLSIVHQVDKRNKWLKIKIFKKVMIEFL